MSTNLSFPRELTEKIRLTEELHDGKKATIYKGTFGKTDIALKRVSKQVYKDTYASSLCEINHQNIVKVLFVITENDGIYLVMDMCHYTLEEYVKKQRHEDSGPSEVGTSRQCIEVLKQITDGIHYLHSNKNLVHRNLNPSNILFYKVETKLIVRISGLNQCIKVDDTDEKNKKDDIFDLATIFYYTLRDGEHTFDSCAKELEKNGEDLNLTFKKKGDMDTVKPLILSMVCTNAEERITVKAVKKHYLFWSGAQTVSFFQSVSNYLEDYRHSEMREKVNDGHEAVLDKEPHSMYGKNVWKDKIPETHKALHDSLVRWQFTTKNTLCDLLRVIRNWSAHYHDRKTTAKMREVLGMLPDGFANYFLFIYPKLLPYIYEVIECKKGMLVFRDFYEVSDRDFTTEPDEEEEISEPSSPKQRIVVIGRTKGGVYHYDPSAIKLDRDSLKIKMPNPKSIKIEGTSEIGDDNTLTAVSIGCRIYAIAWIGYIFETDLSNKEKNWFKKTGQTSSLHGKHPPAAVIGDCIYICGGGWAGRKAGFDNERNLPSLKVSKACEVFNTKDGSVRKLPDLNKACRHNAVVAVGEKLYSIGGKAGGGELLDAIEVYDTKQKKGGDKWEIRTAHLRIPRRKAAAVALGQTIFILGGKIKEGKRSGASCLVEQYDIGKDECTTIREMSICRSKFTACVIDSRIYVVGRMSGSRGYPKEIWLEKFENGMWYKRELLEKHIEPICLAVTF